MTQTMKKQSEITATAISRIVGQDCWYVPSDDKQRTNPYKVCYEKQSASWSCECKHGEFSATRGISCNCKHTRACQVSVLANLNRARAEAEQKRIAREQWNEFQFQCGAYNHYWN